MNDITMEQAEQIITKEVEDIKKESGPPDFLKVLRFKIFVEEFTVFIDNLEEQGVLALSLADLRNTVHLLEVAYQVANTDV